MVVEIPLTKGFVTVVDDEDAERVMNHKWYVILSGSGTPYAGCTSGGKQVLLHRFLLDPPPGLFVDHINRDTLNNQRSNLRLATKSQNAANTLKLAGNFKGVNWRPKSRRWRATIKVNDRHQHLGYFDTECEAAHAYDAAAIEAFGEFALLNFPEGVKS